jgi:hypothetical protein
MTVSYMTRYILWYNTAQRDSWAPSKEKEGSRQFFRSLLIFSFKKNSLKITIMELAAGAILAESVSICHYCASSVRTDVPNTVVDPLQPLTHLFLPSYVPRNVSELLCTEVA